MFLPGWLTYDANRDWTVTWDEARYVRFVLEGEEGTNAFWKHFKGTETDYVAGETMSYDEAFTVWTRDYDGKKDFDTKWQMADSDRNWEITINDIYAVVGVIPGLTDEDVP